MQETTETAGRTRMNRTQIIVIIAALAVAAGTIITWFMLPGILLTLLTNRPEHSAKYYPQDTVVYAWLTLAPGKGQKEEGQRLWEQIREHPDARNYIDDLRETLQDEYGIDTEDLRDWIGAEISLGIIDPRDRKYQEAMAMTIDVRDPEAAREFLEDWVQHLERKKGHTFRESSSRRFNVWTSRQGPHIALSDDLLALAASRENLESIIRRAEDGNQDSLEDLPQFREARESLPERRFASLYIDSRSIALDHLEENEELAGLAQEQIPRWVALSTGLFDRTLVARVNLQNRLEGPMKRPDLQPPDNLMPRRTNAYLAATFDQDPYNWRRALREYGDLEQKQVEMINNTIWELAPALGVEDPPQLRRNADPGDLVDLSLDLLEQATGIDFRNDLIAHLSGAFALAIHPTDLQEVRKNPFDNALPAVAMLSHRQDSGQELEETLLDVADLVEERTGTRHMMVDLGGDRDAVVYRTGMEYQPAHILHQGFLILATTERALARTVSLEGDPEGQLRSDPEYRRALERLPKRSQFLLYLDLHNILRQADSEDFGMEQTQLRALQDTLGRLVISSHSPHCRGAQEKDAQCQEPRHSSVTTILTLLEE